MYVFVKYESTECASSLSIQIILPGALCSWLLCCPSQCCCARLNIRSSDLRPHTRRPSSVGLVCMGYDLLSGLVSVSDLACYSVCQFPRWNQDWATEDSPRCIPSLVSLLRPHASTYRWFLSARLFYFILAWMILIQWGCWKELTNVTWALFSTVSIHLPCPDSPYFVEWYPHKLNLRTLWFTRGPLVENELVENELKDG